MVPGLPPDFPEDSNPYAPPKTEFGTRHEPKRSGVIPFNVGDILTETWEIYKDRLTSCLAICWGVAGMTWAGQFAGQFILQGLTSALRDPVVGFVVPFAIFFGNFVFQVWLTVGQNLAMLKLGRKEDVGFEEVFHGGPFVLTTIIASILFGLTMLVVALAGMVWIPLAGVFGQRGGPAAILIIVLGGGLAIFLGIWLAARLSQFYYLILDQNAGIIDSLRFSWELTRGRVSTLILVYLMGFAINLAGLLAFCVGLIFTVPLTNLMLAVTYLAMTGQPTGAARSAVEDWDEDFFEPV